jgi:anthranilate phosphoribosyltransferase
LLALLLAREGLAVVVHGMATENGRTSTQKVLETLGRRTQSAIESIANGELQYLPTELLCPGLARLLDVRRVVGLRNPAHSLVKLMVPVQGPSVLVSSYTHPEYLHSMTATLALTHTTALLLRGTEGEPVADARRTPAMDAFAGGLVTRVQEAQTGPLSTLPDVPGTDPAVTAAYIQRVLAGDLPVPHPIALQVRHVCALATSTASTGALA